MGKKLKWSDSYSGVNWSSSSSSYSSNIITAWELGEQSGTRADSGPSSYTLTDLNTTSYGGSIVSNARDLNGTTQRFQVANSSTVQTGNIDYTFCCWVFLDAVGANNDTIVSKRAATGAADWEYILRYTLSSNRFTLIVSNGTTSTTVNANTLGAPSAKTWYFITAGYNATTGNIFINVNNGATDTQTVGANTPATNSAPLVIGALGNPVDTTYADFLDGKINCLMLYKKVLTTQEQTDLYNGGYALRYSELTGSLLTSLVAMWNMDGTSGNEADSVAALSAVAANSPIYRCGIYKTTGDAGSARFVTANLECLYRNTATMPNLENYTGNFTLELAYRRETISVQQSVFMKGGTGTTIAGIWVQVNASNILQVLFSNGIARVTPSVATGQTVIGELKHVVVSVTKGGNMLTYLNGALINTTDISSMSTEIFGTASFAIGAQNISGTNALDGEVGFARIYNFAFGQTDTDYVYNSGALRTYAQL